MPAMVLGGRAADRWGYRAVLVCSGALMGLSFAGLGLVGGYASLLGVLVLWCAASGVYDVGVNAIGVVLEQATGRGMMAVLHAAFSGGGAAGALISGLLLSANVDYRYIYAGALLPVGLIVLVLAISRFPQETPAVEGEIGFKKASLYRNLLLVLVGAIAALTFFSEGTMEDWSGVYLRQTLALPALLGGSGVAVYHAAMAVGRLGSAAVIRRFGNRKTLLCAGSLVVAGMSLALATSEPLVVVAGFLVVGLALSAATPISFSIAGQAFPDRAGAASSVVATLGYSGFLLGPAIVGGIAEVSSLRAALLTIVLAGFLIFALGARLEKAGSDV